MKSLLKLFSSPLFLEFPKGQTSVRPAKTEGVGEGKIDLSFLWLVPYEVQSFAILARVIEVEYGRYEARLH